MSLSIYAKGDYEEFHALRRRKNKAKQACPFSKFRAGSERSRMEPIFPPSGGNPTTPVVQPDVCCPRVIREKGRIGAGRRFRMMIVNNTF